MEVVAGAKFQYVLHTYALNATKEARIDGFQGRSSRSWSREPLPFLVPPEERRSNDQLRDCYKLSRWSLLVRRARFRYGKKVLLLPRPTPAEKCSWMCLGFRFLVGLSVSQAVVRNKVG